MELPRALAPWGCLLGIFPPEIAVGLGPTIQRLAAAIGPMRAHSTANSGDPDGYGDLAQRGSYERLLVSEWLLADELPDEFVRRAAMSEHAFLQLAFREPTGGRASVALFDSGPDQIGSPRIAQIAALIVLARRAGASGAAFWWGIIQQPTAGLSEGCDEPGIRRLLASRTASSPSYELTLSDGIGRAASMVGPGAPADIWLVGGRQLADAASGLDASLLILDDVYSPDEPKLSATIRPRARPERHLEIVLPDDRTCARLIRDPFQTAVARPSRRLDGPAGPLTEILFTPRGAKLLARTDSGDILAFPVPNSASAPPGQPRRYTCRPGEHVVAAGRLGKASVAAVATGEDSLRLVCFGGKCGQVPVGDYFTPQGIALPAPGDPLGQILPLGTKQSQYEGMWNCGGLIHIGGTLFGFGARQPNASAAPLVIVEVGFVAAVRLMPWGLALVSRQSSLWVVATINQSGRQVLRHLPECQQCFFGYGGSFGSPHYGILAVEQDDRSWHILSNAGVDMIREQPGTVVGVLDWVDCPRPGLVVIDSDRRAIKLVGRDWDLTVTRSPTRIKHAAVSTVQPWIAYVTEENEVVTYSLPRGAVTSRSTADAAFASKRPGGASG